MSEISMRNKVHKTMLFQIWKIDSVDFVFFQGSGADGSQQQKAAERQAQVEDMKNSILSQVLTQEARARRT